MVEGARRLVKTGIMSIVFNLLLKIGRGLVSGLDQVTPARGFVVALIAMLIVLHGVWPDGFVVDGVTVGLLSVLVIVVLVPLLKSATFPGGAGVEFRHDLDQLRQQSEQAAVDQSQQLESSPSAEVSVDPDAGGDGRVALRTVERSIDALVEEILSEAARSPRVGLMLLSAELERLVRQLLLSSGWGDRRSATSLRQGVDRLVEVGVLTRSAASALTLFNSVRNEIVHGVRTASDDEVLRAIDAGIPLLRTIAAIPHERHVVVDLVPIFSDEEGATQIPETHGLVLESRSPGGVATSRRIFPTTRGRDDYPVGVEVSWEWGPRQWGKAWYREPATGDLLPAWEGSMEFTGRPLT